MRRRPLPCLSLLAAVALGGCAASRPAPAVDDAIAGPEWARGAVFYEVFVRSFQDSDGDGKGDLPGLIARLDELNDGDPATSSDLGVDALWLMPVFKSPSYHGYDATDYETINRDYGTNEDFARLCREAHRRGMRVIVDLVLNHTSSQHPWFLLSASSRPRQYRDWYIWRKENPGWTRTWDTAPAWHRLPDRPDDWFYGLFWEEMPDLDWRNPAVREEMKYVARLWLDRGADGFRLDAVRHLVEDGPGAAQEDTEGTHEVLKELSAWVRLVKPDALLVGEAWTDEMPTFVRYFGDTRKLPTGDELPMLFDFGLSGAILDGLKTGRGAPIAARLEANRAAFPPGVIDAPFLTNHDMIRVGAQLGGDAAKLRSGAAILLTLPGAPFLYYGEEIGMRQPPNNDDEFKRTPMQWDATPGGGFTSGTPWQRLPKDRAGLDVASQRADPASLRSRYRDLIRLRHASEALRRGDLEVLPAPEGLLAFARRGAGEAVLVLHNLSDAAATAGPLVPEAGRLVPLLADPGVAPPQAGVGGWTVTLPPHASGVWRILAR